VERVVADLGFRVVLAALPEASDDPEEALLIEFTARPDFTPVGAGSRLAFSVLGSQGEAVHIQPRPGARSMSRAKPGGDPAPSTTRLLAAVEAFEELLPGSAALEFGWPELTSELAAAQWRRLVIKGIRRRRWLHISTLRKHGINVLAALRDAINGNPWKLQGENQIRIG
jgi:hypothetical protein